MSRDQREAFEAAYRRAALVAEAELVDLGGSPTTDDRDHS